MNFIDTSPFYGRGMSECLLGVALRGVPRDSLLPRDQARPVRRRPLRLLGPPGRRERRRQPAPDGRRPPRHHPLPRHRVRRDVADRRGDAARAPEDPGAGQGPVHRDQRLSDEHLPVRPRPRPTSTSILSYNHYTLQNTMLADLVPLPEGQGRGRHERRAVLGPAPDQRPAARPGTRPRPRSATICRQRRRTLRRARAWTSPSSPCSTRSPTRT